MELIFVMDDPRSLDPRIDTTLGMIEAAVGRGHTVRHCRLADLEIDRGSVRARTTLPDGEQQCSDLAAADVVLLRADPPVDRAYIDATLILDHVRHATMLVNDPVGVRVANEKLWALHFPWMCPPTLVSSSESSIVDFVRMKGPCVAKPIDGHGGRGVVRLREDGGLAALVDLVTGAVSRQVVVQPWIDGVGQGNKRIFVHHGDPVGAVLRFPSTSDFRIGPPAQLAELTAREREMCHTLRPELKRLGLSLVGLDVIDGWLIDVNVTSSGALRKTDMAFGTQFCSDFIRDLEVRLAEKGAA